MSLKVVPITKQPEKSEFGDSGQQQIPNGFSCLANLDTILISQTREGGCFEIKHFFRIKDSQGMDVLKADEEKMDCFQSHRGDVILRELQTDAELVRFRMHRQWAAGCGFSSIEIIAPEDNFIGTVEQVFNFFGTKFLIKNGQGEPALWIEKGSGVHCCSDHKFKILSADSSSQVGEATRLWGGLAKEMMKPMNNFQVSLPIDMDVKLKIIVVCTVIWMDYIYYSNQRNAGAHA